MLFILYNLKTYKPERTHKTLCVCVYVGRFGVGRRRQRIMVFAEIKKNIDFKLVKHIRHDSGYDYHFLGNIILISLYYRLPYASNCKA